MKYHFVVPPRPHQRKALSFLLKNRGGGLQVPMRWGKTATAIHFANCLHLLEGVQRVLVVCPISALGVWPDQIEKFTPPDIKLEWRIVNFEQTYKRKYTGHGRSWRSVPNQELADFHADLLIVDESHNIGNPTTVSSKCVYDLARRCKFRLIMTGTMFHRKPFFVFGQARVFDPSLFGDAWNVFKRRITIFGGYGGYEVVRYINLDWMMDKLRPWVYMEEYVPPGKPVVNELWFDLTGKGLDFYLEMEKESIIEVKGEHVVSSIPLTKHLRLQQIAGGWVRTGSGKYRRVGDDALRVANDRFREYYEQGITKVVVGCRFIPEIADLARAAAQHGFRPILMHGAVKKELRPERIKDFQTTDDAVMFICQINTAKEGIDLSAADVMMLYSLSESFVSHDQFVRRIERYNDDRTLMYDYVLSRGTRAQVSYEALKLKQDVARFIIKNPHRVEEITQRGKT